MKTQRISKVITINPEGEITATIQQQSIQVFYTEAKKKKKEKT